MNYKKRNIKKDSASNVSKKNYLFNKGKISIKKRKHNKSLYIKHNEKAKK